MSTGDGHVTTTPGTPSMVQQPTSVTAVSIRLPPFWDRNPATWFIQAEAQFHLSGITAQTTKFYYVIAALSPSAADEVYNVIASPPANCPYDKLKSALLKRTTCSDRARLQQLLSAEELGDRRPTQLLRRMKQLLGDGAASASDSFLRELFLQKLPRNVQMVLATTTNLSTDELATLSDAVMEVAIPSPSVMHVETPHPPFPEPTPSAVSQVSTPAPTQYTSQHMAAIESLTQQVNNLTNLVATLAARNRSPSPRRFRRRSLSPRGRRSPSPRSNGMCWYHQRFGAEARHCFQPCLWSGNAPPSH
ncbi:uncharacterized protein LOC135395678 [Ornithodoros turicata]|uniref:uncharacterized protein LOC135395678 n=1 Tax=Ornithodoros turicata TaxID=34597 RepID=UPI003139DB12